MSFPDSIESQFSLETIHLVLEPEGPQPLPAASGIRLLTSVNAVRGVEVEGAGSEAIYDPYYGFNYNEPMEQLTLLTPAAERFLRAYSKIINGNALARWEGQWVLRYVMGERRTPRTPLWRHGKEMIDTQGPINRALEEASLYAASQGMGRAVMHAVLTLDNPSRGMIISGRGVYVADMADLARLGTHITPHRPNA